MKKLAKVGIGAASALILATGALAPAAHADPSPTGTSAANGDIVGVGSDTVQYADDFVADGYQGTNGYNFFNPAHRIASFDASNSLDFSPTGTQNTGDFIKLRGGSGTTFAPTANPNIIARPNGSGAGLVYLCAATTTCGGATGTNDAKIDFSRSSSALTSDSLAVLDQHPFAQDTIQIAVNNTGTGTKTNAPTALTTGILKRIYEPTTASDSITTWNQIDPSYSTDTIIPLLPQTGSGTRNTFLTDLFGTKTPALNANIVTVEEHDPSFFIDPTKFVNPALTTTNPPSTTNFKAGAQIDAIAPFSGARVSLYNAGYFNYFNTKYANAVTLLAGTSTAATDNYENTRTVYNITRQSARNTSWEGSSFSPSGFFCGDTGQALSQAAGMLPLPSSVTCGGAQ